MNFSLQLDATPQGLAFRVLHFSPGITVWDLGRAAVALAFQLFQRPNLALTTSAPSPELIARDYPALVLHRPSGSYLCAACADLYEGSLEISDDDGPSILKLPPSPLPIPCTFHLAPDRAPISAARAAEIQNALDEAAGRVVTV